MKLLLDTQSLLWILDGDERLSQKAKDLYLSLENDICLSAASIWEIAIKVSSGKLHLGEPLPDFIDTHIHGSGIQILQIEVPDLFPVETLPYHHRDPFDRLIIAQAMVRQMPILSADTTFDHYAIQRLW